MEKNEKAKIALDKIISKSRAHWYKPIQIAEILYHHRVAGTIDLNNLADYRIISKKWRDEISLELLGRVCTSSTRFQDNLFEANAMPPETLAVLGEENTRSGGAVEAYIYRHFKNKLSLINHITEHLLEINPSEFKIDTIIDYFRKVPGLKRSLDKVFEIIVYSLFITVIDALELTVSIAVNDKKRTMLAEFESFAQHVLSVDLNNPIAMSGAKVFRVGVTNAADRGLDMYSNWGPAIQIKHLTLDEELAESIVDSVSADRIIIVCRSADEKVLLSVFNQVGWKARIQSVITEEDLYNWYEKALRGRFYSQPAKPLIDTIIEEMETEFPVVAGFPKSIRSRQYDKINDPFWR